MKPQRGSMRMDGIKLAILGTLLGMMSAQSANALRVNVMQQTNFTTVETDKLNQAVTVLNQVLNSPDFKDRVLNFAYNGQIGFVQNNGMNNQQIYDYLMAGAEKYPTQQEPNQMADMNLTIFKMPWYKRFSKELAYTNTDDPFLHMRQSYYDGASVSDISNTLIHEWTHKMGFDHDFNATAQRPYSVPYGIGGIIADLVSAQTK
jgi:hypothetical protein